MLDQRASFFTAIYRRSLAILATIYFLDPFERETDFGHSREEMETAMFPVRKSLRVNEAVRPFWIH